METDPSPGTPPHPSLITTLSRRISLVLLAVLVAAAAVVTTFELNGLAQDVGRIRAAYMGGKERVLREGVEAAVAYARYRLARAKAEADGPVDTARVQREVLDWYQHCRIDGEYLFAGRWDGLSLVGPAKGRNMIGLSDVNGKPIVAALITRARRGGGFVDYVIPAFDGHRQGPKLSYVEAIPEWRWYVGAGVYVDQVEAQVAARRTEVYRRIALKLGAMGAMFLAIAGIAQVAARRLARRTREDTRAFLHFFERAAVGDAHIDPDRMAFAEFQALAGAAEDMNRRRRQAESALVQSQAALRASQERLSFAMKGANDGLFDWALDTGYVYYSPRWKAMLGYAEGELPDRFETWEQLVDGADRERVLSMVQDYAAGRRDHLEVEYRMRHKDGHWVNILSRGHLVRDDAGRTVRLVGTHVDISARKRAEAALAASEARFRTLVEVSNHSIQEIDTEGGIRYANPASAVMLGYSQQALSHMNVADLLPPEDRDRFRRDLREWVRAQQEPTPYYNRNRTADGRILDVQVDWNYTRDAAGRITGFVSIVTDITDYHRSRKLLDGRNRVLEMLARGLPLQDMLLAIVEYVERIVPERRCAVQLLDPAAGTLHTAAAPHLPADFTRALEGVRIGPTAGCCGASAATGRRVVVADVLEHPNWAPYRDLIRPTGLRACWSQPILSPAGQVLGTFAIYGAEVGEPAAAEIALIDSAANLAAVVIEHERAERTIREAEEQFRLLLESSTEGIFGLDAQGRVTFINPAGAGLLGFSVHDLIGRGIHALVHHSRADGSPLPEDDCGMLAAARHGEDRHVSDDVLWRRDGSSFPVEFRATPVWRERRLDGAVVTFHDITARRRAEAEIQHLAFHDTLTGLPNRLLFKEELGSALASLRRDGRRFALHMLDLDHFKDVNDGLGHPVGDELLGAVARRIGGMLRGSDIFSRFGGDEFALLQGGIADEADASVLADKIIAAVGREFLLDGKTLSIATSVGIVVAAPGDHDVDELITRADVALYKAKGAGRGRYAFFEDEMTRQLQREMELTRELAQALPKGELRLVFQPQLDLASGALAGMEALVRWRHPRRGLLEPATFLDVAESRGMIRGISDWVLVAACRQAAAWAGAGLAFGRVAVNLCAQQVSAPGFAERVEACLRDAGASPEHLELEFTETVLMEFDDRIRADIVRLSEQGVLFAIDDFGTGFSSLQYLRSFRADKIKIDREFVRDVDSDADDAEIVKATIALGAALGLVTVAEGVETEAQAAFLREHGCRQVQGYLYARPVEAQIIEREWLRAR